MRTWEFEIRTRLADLDLEPAREASIVEELAQHLDDRYRELLASGSSGEQARAAALAELSQKQLLARELRRLNASARPAPVVPGGDRRGAGLLADLRFDLLYGARMLRKRPGFTLVVVATLALGIGVNTAIFSFFDFLLRPMPIADPDRVVELDYRAGTRRLGFSFSDYIYFRDAVNSLSGIAAHGKEKFLLAMPSSRTEEVAGEFVSENFFSLLGARTILGRTFSAEETAAPGRDPVVVLSYRLWQRLFGGDPQIIGTNLILTGKPFEVIGVTERDFVGINEVFNPEAPELWLPLTMRSELPSVYYEEVPVKDRDWFGRRTFHWVNVCGRLAPGRSLPEAQSEIAVLFSRLSQAFPETDSKDRLNLVAAGQSKEEFWQLMGIVLAATGMILLIACSNIANLQLSRAAVRQKEFGLRLCLGASRGRMIRQLLTESLLLAGIGGAAGLLLVWWGLGFAVRACVPDFDKLVLNPTPTWRVLAFTIGLSLASGIIFGLAPALRASRLDLVSVIKEEAAGFGKLQNRWRLRNGLVVAQVTLCLMLLIPAGLLLHGLFRAMGIDPGFETNKVLNIGYSLELSGYDEARAEQFNRELCARIKSIPGVESVSLGVNPLLVAPQGGIVAPREGEKPERRLDNAFVEQATADYFATLGIPIIRGRGFTAEEIRPASAVVIISESTARNLWPGEDPLGKPVSVRIGRDENGAVLRPALVIGVARDVQVRRLGQIPSGLVYIPLVQDYWTDLSMLVRTGGDGRSMKLPVEQLIRSMESTIRLSVETLDDEIANSKWGRQNLRLASQLAASLGGLALVLAAIGIYGVMAYSVTMRTREIGIRMALGAQRRDVLRMVFGQGVRLTAVGVVLGAAGGAALSRVLLSLLFGLSSLDIVTYIGVSILVAVPASVAIYLPARRATRVDPMVALRSD